MARLPRMDAVLIQAVIAGALSFAHLHDLASAAGQAGWKAWAYPISVDLLLVAAWHHIRTLKAVGGPAGSAWCWFCIALAASLGANVATAGLLNLEAVPGWLRILVAGWPAAAFFGGTLLAHTTPAADGNEDQEHEEVPAAVPAVHVDRPEPERPALPEPAATEMNPPAESAPAASASVASVPAVPGVPPALVTHARKVADNHRSQTGQPIDTDTLRTRLGVPAPLAEAIAAQLA